MKDLAKRTIVTMLLVTVLAMFLATGAAANSFSDMPESWSKEAMESAVANGLLKGNEDGMLMPGESITRAEMATVIVRAFGAQKCADVSSFLDVANDSWYYDSMQKIVAMKVMQGAENKLNPDNKITRQEAFVMLSRALSLANGDESALEKFADAQDIAAWAKQGVAALVERGYIKGAGDSLNPNANITREEFAQMMYNIFKNYVIGEGEYSSLKDSVIINVPNVTLSDSKLTDVVIGDGVGEGEIVLKNVECDNLIVRGGGVNSIYISDSDIKNITVTKVDGNVRVVGKDGSNINALEIVDGKDDVIIEGNFDVVDVTSDNLSVIIKNAEIKNLNVYGAGAEVSLTQGAKVSSMDVNAENVTLSAEKGTAIEKLNSASEINGSFDGIVKDSSDKIDGEQKPTSNSGSSSSRRPGTGSSDTADESDIADPSDPSDASDTLDTSDVSDSSDATDSSDTSDVQKPVVSAVSGVNFTGNSGLYIYMDIIQPDDTTGISGYEAQIYNSENPNEFVHRSISKDDGRAYYKLSSTDIFASGQTFNTLNVISVADEEHTSKEWTSPISILPTNTDVSIDITLVENNRISFTLNGVNGGFGGVAFYNNDGDEISIEYGNIPANGQYSINVSSWNETNKALLAQGDIYIGFIGMKVNTMTQSEGIWTIAFQRYICENTKVAVGGNEDDSVMISNITFRHIDIGIGTEIVWDSTSSDASYDVSISKDGGETYTDIVKGCSDKSWMLRHAMFDAGEYNKAKITAYNLQRDVIGERVGDIQLIVTGNTTSTPSATFTYLETVDALDKYDISLSGIGENKNYVIYISEEQGALVNYAAFGGAADATGADTLRGVGATELKNVVENGYYMIRQFNSDYVIPSDAYAEMSITDTDWSSLLAD